jgi:putative phosphoribosyl transferase
MARTIFIDRSEAGRELAQRLHRYRRSAVVLALPRGGVETAFEIAHALDAPLDLLIARKIGHPSWPEYAIGAVTETGPAIWNEAEKAALDPAWLKQAEAAERAEAKRRRQRYLAGRQPVPVADKTAIVVDDGIATGLTMQAAIRQLKQRQPRRIIVAVPVAPPDTVDELLETVDDVVTLVNPNDFRSAVGSHYENFPQLDDADVTRLLEAAN